MKNLFFAFILIAGTGYSQESNSKLRWHASAIGFYSNRLISSNEQSASDQLSAWQDAERGVVRGGLQMGLDWNVSQHMELSGGIQFANRGYRLDTLFDASISVMKRNYSFIEVPITANYRLMNFGHWMPVVGLGIQAGFMCDHRIGYKRIGQTPWFEMNEDYPLNKFQLGFVSSIGVLRDIDEKSTLSLACEYYQSLSSIYTGNISRRLNHLGIRFGIQRRF